MGKILVIIAARGGSKGIKNKNLRIVGGKPLVAHTVTQAVSWGKAAKVVCSTDSLKIAASARKYGALVPFMRPKHLAGDKVGKIPVLRHAVKECEKIFNEKYPVVIDLQATSPIRRKKDMDGCLALFLSGGADSVVSVVPSGKNPYFDMVEKNKSGYIRLSKKSKSLIKRRQDTPHVYALNGSIYVYDREYLMDKKTDFPISKRSRCFSMEDMSSLDIDTEKDLQYLEFLVKKGAVKL